MKRPLKFINMLFFVEITSIKCLTLVVLFTEWTNFVLCQSDNSKSLDVFIESNQQLTKEIPLIFQPDEGIQLREAFTKKYGYRGERLIAMLGGESPAAPPLAVYDAALIDGSRNNPVTSRTKLQNLQSIKNPGIIAKGTYKIHPLKNKEYSSATAKPYTQTHSKNILDDLEESGAYKDTESIIFNRLFSAMYNEVGKTILKSKAKEQNLNIFQTERSFRREPSILVNSYSY